MTPIVPLSREEFERLPRTALGKRSTFKPAVWRVETPSGPVVVKDAGENRIGTRWLARWLIARESAVLRRLAALDGVPRIVGTIHRDAIVLNLVAGRTLDARMFRERPRAVFEQIVELTRRLHAVGVFHLDMHQRKNLLVDDEGRLHLVDFGASLAPGPIVRALLGPALRHADHQAAYKYMARYAPEALTDEEARTVLRHRRVRSLWPFSPHSQRERRAALGRLRASDRDARSDSP
jgi:hypothetical protein